ncbi:hypothetical protein [Chryseobacterium sp. CCH4-E10]|uniref:hypothetical protein n=1 Tax=Chryseobacterium sp. CCH4-E10 TaxID=1768758 RepID=UPI00082A4226|nr:hypothetical protein [Chryseobacterium sp. CCH4-E10]
MKAFYKKLIEVFEKTETKDTYRMQGLNYPKFIDLYAGQDLDEESFDLYPDPAIFVSWQIDHRLKPALVTITFRLSFEQHRDTSNLGRNTTEALKFLDYKETTDDVLRSFESDDTGKLEPATEELNIEPSITDQFVLVYTCSYKNKKNTLNHAQGEINEISLKSGLFTAMLD